MKTTLYLNETPTEFHFVELLQSKSTGRNSLCIWWDGTWLNSRLYFPQRHD